MIFKKKGSQQVKSSDTEFYSMQVLKGNDKISGEGFMYSDRLSFPDESQENLLSTMREGGKAKIYFKERSKYGTPSNYLAEFDFTNFEKAMSKLKSKKYYDSDTVDSIMIGKKNYLNGSNNSKTDSLLIELEGMMN